uniref:Archease domain-containing protein n=1 Tax=Ditylenchus dipsaci TaxID=166011 RepID=A0A915EJB1_9BILA
MYGYMTTDFEKVQNEYSMDFSASGQDLNQMLYNLLDTCLYHFNAEPFFIGRWCQVLSLEQSCQGNCIKTFGDDESFDLKKHPPEQKSRQSPIPTCRSINRLIQRQHPSQKREGKKTEEVLMNRQTAVGQGVQKKRVISSIFMSLLTFENKEFYFEFFFDDRS